MLATDRRANIPALFSSQLLMDVTMHLPGLTAEQRMSMYANGVKLVSLALLITPTVTLYFNTNPKFALGSAMLQMVTELLIKIWTVYVTRVQVNAFAMGLKAKPKGVLGKVKVAVLTVAEDAGVNQDVKQGALGELRGENAQLKLQVAAHKRRIEDLEDENSTLRRRLKRHKEVGVSSDSSGSDEFDHHGPDMESGVEEEGKAASVPVVYDEEGSGKDEQDFEASVDAKRNYVFAMLAVRWHGELVAEKGSIVAAAFVAYLYFEDLVETDSTGLILIGCIFYAVEALCDIVFVGLVDKHMGVPMLSAVVYEPVFSNESVVSAFMLALMFLGMSSCIAMAASVEL